MFLARRKAILFVLSGILIAALSPVVYYGFNHYLHPYGKYLGETVNTLLHFNVAGYYVPWRYIFSLVIVAGLLLYFKKRRTQAKECKREENTNGPILISGKTLLEIHNASRNVQALTKRLDSAEKTSYMIMKQMEEITKCLTRVLKDDSSKHNNNATSSLETHI